MNKDELNLNRDKLLNYIPLPENLKPKEIKPRKQREVKPWKPTPGTLTFYIIEILERAQQERNSWSCSIHYIEVTNRLRNEYNQNVDYKNIATLLYSLAKLGRIRKDPIYKGRYKALAAEGAGPTTEA